MPGRRTLVVGLIGGVGSGKSTIAARLSEHLRVVVLNADAAGHRALTSQYIQNQLRRRFGDGIFTPAGEVRRDRLAALVFGDDAAQRQARHDLEQIVHPEIRSELKRQLEQARQQGDLDVIVIDAALLLEAGWNELCDAVVFVDTPYEQRLARIQASRGWTADELARREQSQTSLEDKRAAADFVINNSGLIEESVRQLLSWIRQRQAKMKIEDRGLRGGV
jgi:dephospho-CoA kinase